MRFVAWDIETNKLAPEDWNENTLKRKRDSDHAMDKEALMNITVAATKRILPDGTEEALVWTTPSEKSSLTCPVPQKVYSALNTDGGEGSDSEEDRDDELLCAPYMAPGDVKAMVEYLEQCVDEGYTISTYNGLSFDFRVTHDILVFCGNNEATERAQHDYLEAARDLKELASSDNHFDIAFSFFAHKGFMISLSKASLATLGPDFQKYEIKGADAPELFTKSARWQNTVIKYCAQDVNMQWALQQKLLETKLLKWITKNENTATWVVPTAEGEQEEEDEDILKLGVKHSMTLPEPDVSWMKRYNMEPWPRQKFTGWLLN